MQYAAGDQVRPRVAGLEAFFAACAAGSNGSYLGGDRFVLSELLAVVGDQRGAPNILFLLKFQVYLPTMDSSCAAGARWVLCLDHRCSISFSAAHLECVLAGCKWPLVAPAHPRRFG